jgi:F-type H+/Na+-transporting ATPase subunit beta
MVNEKSKFVGTVRGLRGQIVDVVREGSYVPRLRELLTCADVPGVWLETYAHGAHRQISCLLLSHHNYIQRNLRIISTGTELTIPVGPNLLGRIIDVFGRPEDGRYRVESTKRKPIFTATTVPLEKQSLFTKDYLIDTGIKVIDFFTPFLKGSRVGLIGGAGVGKTVLLTELLRTLIANHSGVAIFAGIGERIREGHELWRYLERTGVLSKTALIVGQMNENAAVRLRTAWAAAAAAEYFRDEEKKDILFFVDNIYRFAQAGSEVATLLEEIPSEFGYQPTLESEVAEFEGRLVSTKDASITSVQTIYVPADELADPGVTAALPHLDATIVLSRQIAQRGMYPPVDIFKSSSNLLTKQILGNEHYQAVTSTLELLEHHQRLSRIVTIIGEGELSAQDRDLYQRAEKILNYMTQPLFTTEMHTSKRGVSVSRENVVGDVSKILSGVYDEIPKEKFRYIGDVSGAKIDK